MFEINISAYRNGRIFLRIRIGLYVRVVLEERSATVTAEIAFICQSGAGGKIGDCHS
jgi:hypothetical protein